MLLEGKRIIVTGGVTGIGRATTIAYVREGAQVVSVSRRGPEDPVAEKVINEAEGQGPGPVKHVKLDITQSDDVNRVFAEAAEWMGGLDVLANVAGLEHWDAAEDLTEEIFTRMYMVNMLGTGLTNTAALKYFKQSGGGSIINHASFTGVAAMPNMAAYGASKGAVVAYSRCIAKEWGQYNVRVNTVVPAAWTELSEAWYEKIDPEVRPQIDAFLQASIPLGGKFGTPEQCADTNIWLASDRSNYLTGQLIGVDGGMTMTR